MSAVTDFNRIYMDGDINKQISENKNTSDSDKPSSTKREHLCFHHRILHDNKDSFEIKPQDGRTMVAMP